MIPRLILFLAVAAYLAVIGEWALAGLSLTGLIPGFMGLIGAVLSVVALFATGHYILGALVAVTVGAVLYLTNAGQGSSPGLIVLYRRDDLAGSDVSPFGWCIHAAGQQRTLEAVEAARSDLEQSGYEVRVVTEEYFSQHGFPDTREAEAYGSSAGS